MAPRQAKSSPLINLRVSPALWARAKEHAAEKSTTVSQAIRTFLLAWVQGRVDLDKLSDRGNGQ